MRDSFNHIQVTYQVTNMRIEIFKRLIPGIHGMPNKGEKNERWIWRLLEYALPIDALPYPGY